MNSIRRTLVIWLSVGMSSGMLIAAILIYTQARNEANQLFDYQMKQLVASLPAQAFSPLGPSRNNNDQNDGNDQRDVVIQIWDNNGLRIYRSHEHTALPERAELGFANINARGTDWRVYSAQIGNTIVQVAQPLSTRLHLAATMALKTTAPLMLLLPLLALLIWVIVGRSLSSIKRIAKDVQSRDAGSLMPVSDKGVPQEIKPLTSALNDLLTRLEFAIGIQRTFVADAAHELKTPLTALNLQIQLAERATTHTERQEAFADVKQGIERTSRLVQQLLTLARQEPGAVEIRREIVNLSELARNVVADFAPIANTRRIDLGMSDISDIDYISGIGTTTGATISADPDAIRTLLNNLLDNAIRYCPDGAQIDVAINTDARHVILSVCDTGPGIPQSDLSRVMDRFYRVPGTQSKGSGLGLAIVKRIASTHGAEIALDTDEHGLRVRVNFVRQSTQ